MVPWVAGWEGPICSSMVSNGSSVGSVVISSFFHSGFNSAFSRQDAHNLKSEIRILKYETTLKSQFSKSKSFQ